MSFRKAFKTTICFVLFSTFFFFSFTLFAQEPNETKTSAPDALASEEQELLSEANRITKRVVQIRGLSEKNPIKKGVKKRETLRDTLISLMKQDLSSNEIRAEGELFKILGFIDPSLDYYNTFLDLLTSQIAGFYDPKSKELYVMAGLAPQLQQPAMAHEIFHGLQDQHYNIENFERPFDPKHNSDVAVARSALLEGDATAVMIDYTLYESGDLPKGNIRSFIDSPFIISTLASLPLDKLLSFSSMVPGNAVAAPPEFQQSLETVPPVLQKLLLFPYLAGLRFVGILRKNHSWERINKIYTKPPVSTEQIIHPEKYINNQVPVGVHFYPNPLFPGYKLIYDNVLGELQMMLFLASNLPDWAPLSPPNLLSDGAKESTNPNTKTGIATTKGKNGDQMSKDAHKLNYIDASEGWGGDRVKLFQQGDVTVLLSVSSWDTTADALQFFEASQEVLKRRYADPKGNQRLTENRHGQLFEIVGKGKRAFVERWGDVVLFVMDLPNDRPVPTLCSIRKQVWGSFRRTSFDRMLKDATKQYAIREKNQ